MTQPPGMPPPPPPAYRGPPPAYIPPPPPPGYAPAPDGFVHPGGYMPPAGYTMAPGAAEPAKGRVSPTRLIIVFVAVLGIGLAIGAAVILALAPAAKKPDCPDPTIQCGAPPVAPTMQPIAKSSPSPAATAAPSIVRPSGSLVIPSSAPTPGPSIAPTPVPSVSQPTPPPTTAPTTAPSAPPIGNLPQPRPASNAEQLHIGTVWTSSGRGFTFEYDSRIWQVQDEDANGIALVAGQGAVVVTIEGFDAASSSPKALVQSKVKSLSDVILGLTEEVDPARQLPGEPFVGHRQGAGSVLNGTLNSPQGPSSPVDVVILAASDSQISIRVTIVTTDDLRDAAFPVIDKINNSITWPSDAQ